MMSDQSEGGKAEPKPSSGAGQGGKKPKGAGGGPKGGAPQKKRGGLRLTRLGGNDFELDHPKCVVEMELDFEEGIECRKAGDPEAARDALRYALQGCGDNLWVHVALGLIALEDFNDPTLARGHFGYAFELAQRAIPPGFNGRLPQHRDANRPFYDAIDGLIACYVALSRPRDVDSLRDYAETLTTGRRPSGGSSRGGPPGSPRAPDRS